MTDIFTKEKRSFIMSRIKGKWTKPELMMKNVLERMDIPYIAHSNLPGKPDFMIDNTAVFVHGCFWHGCEKHFKTPKTNVDFWTNKIDNNRKRDKRNRKGLNRLGYRTMIIWEHDIKKIRLHNLENRLNRRFKYGKNID